MKKQGSVVVIALVLVLCISITGAEENNSDKYTLEHYGGEEFTPQPMEFGENLKNEEKDESLSIRTTERKHVYLQFYSTPNNDQLGLLETYGVYRVGIAGANTYMFSMPADMTPADLPAESGLRWMGPIPVENKYDRTHGLDVPAWARAENGEVKLAIYFYENIASQDSASIVTKYSENYSTPLNGMPYYYEITINESDITLLASEDTVYKIAYYGYETVPAESRFVDYVESTEEDIGDSTAINEQETNDPDEENSSNTEVNKSPSFSSTLAIFILSIVLLHIKRRGAE